MADTPVIYSPAQHQALINQEGYPVYLLCIDLRSSVGGGFEPSLARALQTLAVKWGVSGTAMQHWAIMVDGFVYELARKPEGNHTADVGMRNNPTFKRPEAIPYRAWEAARKVKQVGWRKFHYTRKTKAEITEIAQAIAEDLQKYDAFKNNCQHFVTTLYDQLGCGYNTQVGWASMSSDILPKQILPRVTRAALITDATLITALSSMMSLLTMMQM